MAVEDTTATTAIPCETTHSKQRLFLLVKTHRWEVPGASAPLKTSGAAVGRWTPWFSADETR